MPPAARTIAEWSSAISIDDIPEDVLTDAKLHVLDTLGCGLAAHAGGIATEGRATMAELGGEPQATVIGSDRRLPAANAAFANAMLCHGLDFDDTHSDSVSHVSTVISPAALAAAEQAGAGRARYARRDRRRQRGRLPDRDGGAGSLPRTGLPSHRDLRRLRRRRGGRPARRASTPRRRRARSGSPARSRAACSPTSPTGHRRSRCTRPGRHTAPTSRRGSPRTARPGRRRCSRGSSASTTPSSAPRTARSTSPPSSPISGRAGRRRGSPTSRSRSATSCTARSVRRPRRPAGRTFSPDEIEDVLVSVPEAGVSLVLEPADQKRTPRSEYEGKFSLQYSVASMLVRGHVAVSDFTDEAIADPAVLAVAAKVRYETRAVPDLSAGVPGRGRRPARRRDVVRGRLPVPEGRAGEPALGRRGAREVPRERRARAAGRAGRGARGGDPRARGARRRRGSARAARVRRGGARMTTASA